MGQITDGMDEIWGMIGIYIMVAGFFLFVGVLLGGFEHWELLFVVAILEGLGYAILRSTD